MLSGEECVLIIIVQRREVVKVVLTICRVRILKRGQWRWWRVVRSPLLPQFMWRPIRAGQILDVGVPIEKRTVEAVGVFRRDTLLVEDVGMEVEVCSVGVRGRLWRFQIVQHGEGLRRRQRRKGFR